MICLLTGVTGLLGSHTAIALIEAGHRVVALARGRSGVAAEARVLKVLRAWPGWGERPFPRSSLTVVEGDVSLPACGLGETEIELLRNGVAAVVHCAASVSFGGGDSGRDLAVNVEGVRGAVGLAGALGCRRMIHISTAYVERGLRGEPCRTPYEASKLEGERVLAELAPRHGVETAVVRPAIVTGDRTFGFTPTYNGIYPFLRCAAQFGARLHRVSPSRWLPGELYREGRVNLVPADHVAAVIRAVVEEGAGAVYPVTAPVPWLVRDLVEVVAGHYGVAADTAGHEVRELLNVNEERAFSSLLELYTPYFTADLGADVGATTGLLARRGIPPVENDPAWIRALLSWGAHGGWMEA